MATYDVSDRSAIVTGGGSGLGRAISLLLAANGAAVLVADRHPEAADETVKDITDVGGTARSFSIDVTDYAAVETMVAAAGELGPLKVAVNNAGIGGDSAPIAEYSLDSWHSVINVNLNAVFYCLRAEIPAMISAGGGSIINMASVLGSVGFANASAYVTAKHGLVGLTRNAAHEYAANHIRVNAVGPGFIVTPLLEANLDSAAVAYLSGRHALGRLGAADEVAGLVAFLASDAASFVTGSYHLVDGGYAAQ